MGKDLNGKELGKGITQRKDGIYQARVFKPGYGKPIYLYAVSAWFEDWMKIYKFPKTKLPLYEIITLLS